MLRHKLLYAALVLGLACFYVLYIDYLPLVLLICALAIPLVLKAGLLWLHFSSDAALECSALSCTAAAQIPVTVVIRNRSPLWFSKGMAKVRITHGFGGGKEILRMQFPLREKNTARLTFSVSAQSCGIVSVELLRVRVFDVFRLLHTNIRRSDAQLSILVLPKPMEIGLDISAPPVEDLESTQFADKPGDDPSELYGIREYCPGDAVSRIHWKLSSHSDVLYLKEFGAPIDRRTLLLVEYVPPSGEQGSLREAETLLTVLYSLAYQLVMLRHPCTAAWYDSSRDEVMRYALSSEASLDEAFRALYSSMYEIGNEEASLRYALSTEQFSSAVLLTNLPDSQMLGILEHVIPANHRTMLIISHEETPLESDETDILTVSPEEPAIDRLTV